MLDVGQSEDWFALQIALAPCTIGYGVVAKHLYDDPQSRKEGNHYWSWIQNYVAEDYMTAVKASSGACRNAICSLFLDDLTNVLSPSP